MKDAFPSFKKLDDRFYYGLGSMLAMPLFFGYQEGVECLSCVLPTAIAYAVIAIVVYSVWKKLRKKKALCQFRVSAFLYGLLSLPLGIALAFTLPPLFQVERASCVIGWEESVISLLSFALLPHIFFSELSSRMARIFKSKEKAT